MNEADEGAAKQSDRSNQPARAPRAGKAIAPEVATEAQVAQLDHAAVVGQEHVRRLDVCGKHITSAKKKTRNGRTAVHDAAAVHGAQRVRYLSEVVPEKSNSHEQEIVN